MRKLTLSLVSLLLIAGCGGDPAAPTAVSGPSANWMNNPDNGNPMIFRYESGYAACYTDPSNGLRVCLATVPLGGGTEPDCGLQGAVAGVAIQEVWGTDDVRQNLMGDVWVTIRDLTQAGACFNAALVAEGWGRAHSTDNDLFGAGPDENNANAWGVMWSGAGTTPAGAAVGFNGHARWVYSNTRGFKVLSLTVNVR